MTKFTYFPWDDASEFEVALQTPEGSNLERTAQKLAPKSRAASKACA